jgi:3-oxoacyl-[acyl-carrier-protein] synthase-1
MKKNDLTIAALGLATPIGCGKAVVANQLAKATRQGLIPMTDQIPGHQVMVGAVTAPLPALPTELPQFASRNNRLLLLALTEIQPELTAAIRRFGRHRVAVVLGTSTSGKAEGEEAMAQMRRGAGWPQGFDLRVQEAGNLG